METRKIIRLNLKTATAPETEPQLEIPWQSLSTPALEGLIEEFVTRDGTEYGPMEVSLARKVEQVKRQLAQGVVYVSFDPESGTASLHSRVQ